MKWNYLHKYTTNNRLALYLAIKVFLSKQAVPSLPARYELCKEIDP